MSLVEETAMTCYLYRHFDSNNELLYVGISLSALVRLGQHKEHSHWYHSIVRVEIEQFPSRKEALLAETKAIENENPKHNKKHNKKRSTKAEKLLRQKQTEDDVIETHARDSHDDMVQRLVVFKPIYTLAEAAEILRVSKPAVKRMIEGGLLGHMMMTANEHHGPKPYISGWQIMDFIETHLSKNAFSNQVVRFLHA